MATDFLVTVTTIDWLAHVGKPIIDPPVKQIHCWEEWPGPEEPSALEVACRQQALRDALWPTAPTREITDLWTCIHETVLEIAARNVPYDRQKDCWHAPNAAVSQGQWVASLMGHCMILNHPIPDELAEQWKWFSRGHWPCYREECAFGKIVVF